MTGTSATATAFSSSGITDALVNDMYLNTSTGYTYRCTVAGNASTAKWVYAGSIKGATGAKGDPGTAGATGAPGTRGSPGTAMTGTSATATVFSSSGITDALVNDMYLNTSTGYTYRCTVAGNASTAKWVYAGSIKGATGATGATGPQGTAGAKGDKGDKGDTGAKGDPGTSMIIDSSGNVSTVTNPTAAQLETTRQQLATIKSNAATAASNASAALTAANSKVTLSEARTNMFGIGTVGYTVEVWNLNETARTGRYALVPGVKNKQGQYVGFLLDYLTPDNVDVDKVASLKKEYLIRISVSSMKLGTSLNSGRVSNMDYSINDYKKGTTQAAALLAELLKQAAKGSSVSHDNISIEVHETSSGNTYMMRHTYTDSDDCIYFRPTELTLWSVSGTRIVSPYIYLDGTGSELWISGGNS